MGGPATHSADLADELKSRGHDVTVITLWNGARREQVQGLVRYPRRWPWPIRHFAVAAWIVRHRSEYDVVYAAGLHPAAVAGARLAGRPVVAKVAGDSAWERARRLGLTDATLEDFQSSRGLGIRVAVMAWLRNWSLRKATTVIAPSEYLARMITAWIGPSANVHVIPNGVRIRQLHRGEFRAPTQALRTIYVGRLVRLKRLDILLEAVARCPDVSLEIVGEGPERNTLEKFANRSGLQARISFLGARSHKEVLRRMIAAHALLLASEHEGLPHVAIEALACGTPVIAAKVGGIGEVIQDGMNGLLVEEARPEKFALAIGRFQKDERFRRRLSQRALIDAERWRFERFADEIESLLHQVVSGQPTAVFLGKGWSSKIAGNDLERRGEILCRHLLPTIVTAGGSVSIRRDCPKVITVSPRRPGLIGNLLFHTLGPTIAVLLALGKRSSAVICQSPYEGFGTILLSRLLPKAIRPRCVIEVHGDWQMALRLYGGRARGVLQPLADAAGRYALRRADRVRVVSRALEELVRRTGYDGPIDVFIAFTGFEVFEEPDVTPQPSHPRVAFIGALERSKGVDVLLEAWARVTERLSKSELVIAGSGSMLQEIRSQVDTLGLDSSVSFLGDIPRQEVRRLLDSSSLLVLPSRSEGLGRVILEAFARSRPVVGTRTGGIPELVEHGRNGLLVAPEDPNALAEAIVILLEDPDRLRAMGEEGRRRALERNPLSEFEAGIARLASWIASP